LVRPGSGSRGVRKGGCGKKNEQRKVQVNIRKKFEGRGTSRDEARPNSLQREGRWYEVGEESVARLKVSAWTHQRGNQKKGVGEMEQGLGAWGRGNWWWKKGRFSYRKKKKTLEKR